MIGVAAFLLLVALGLLAGGLAQGSAALQWGSFAASALAALTLAVGELRRKRSARAADGDEEPARPEDARSEVESLVPAAADAAVGVTGSAAPVAPSAEPQVPPTVPAEPEPQPILEGRPVDSSPVRTASHSAEAAGPATGAHAAVAAPVADGEPPVEEVEVSDLLLVLDLTDEVFVIDEHPRYHVAGCPRLDGVDTIPLPMVEARTDGFTPCGTCTPDHVLAERERARRTRR